MSLNEPLRQQALINAKLAPDLRNNRSTLERY